MHQGDRPVRAQSPEVDAFYEPRTGSIQYVVSDPATRRCAIIDPVWDFDEKSASTATGSADAILDHVRSKGLEVEWILDTHPHADHFSAAAYLREQTGAPTAIGAKIGDVQALWEKIYNLPAGRFAEAPTWDRLFEDGATFRIGELDASVLLCAGHTLASVVYVVGDAAFINDTLFMPDSGTARTDFPGGSPAAMWRSIQAILALPDATRLFTGHDYRPNGREPRWESTVGGQKRTNIHLAGKSEAEFVAFRAARDRTLPMPALILQALQVNLRGGRLPPTESDGRHYLKMPVGAFPDVPWH